MKQQNNFTVNVLNQRTFFALLIIIIALGGVLAATSIQGLAARIDAFLNPPASSASVISSQTIINGIEPLAELTTVRVELAKINVRVNVDYGTGSGCSHTARYAVAGEFEAGIDLGQLKPNAISYDETNNTYKLTLPGARLTDCTIRDSARYEVVGMGICPGGANRDDTEPIARHVALNEFRDEVLEQGILDRAQREARAVISNFVTTLVAVNTSSAEKPVIQVEFERQGATRPPSCRPDAPDGWEYDTQTSQWKRIS